MNILLSLQRATNQAKTRQRITKDAGAHGIGTSMPTSW